MIEDSATTTKVVLKARSAKGKSRIGKGEVDALVEQSVELPNGDAKLFVIISFNHCRWVLLKNDPDFEVRFVD